MAQGGGCLTPWDPESKRIHQEEGTSPTLTVDFGSAPKVLSSYSLNREIIPENGTAQGKVESYEVCPTLDACGKQHGTAYAFVGGYGGDTQMGLMDECSPTMTAKHPMNACAPAAVTQFGDEVAGTLTARHDSSPCADRGQNVTAYSVKVRCGADTYVKPDGSTGTAGKGALASEEQAFTVAATQDQTLFVMASAHAHAEIGRGGLSPTLMSHAEKAAPILFGPPASAATART